jgi:hypothetical protein
VQHVTGLHPARAQKENQMTLRQTLQSAPAKAKDLLDRLANTSNQALKTRENLVAELTNELPLYVGLEEEHLLPHLRKNAETKPLAADAVKIHKDLREQLAELTAAPIDSEQFRQKADELRTTFQRHVSNTRKGLPALLKALDDEDENQIAENIDTAMAKAEEAEREAKRLEAAARKAEREATEQAAAAERQARRSARAAARKVGETAERAVDTLAHGVSVAEGGVRRAAGALTTQAQNAAGSAREALTAYTDTVREAGGDLQTLGESSRVALSVVGELRTAWMGWARKAIRANVGATQQLIRCRSVREIAELQRDLVGTQMRELLDGSRQVLQVAERTAQKAVQPLDNRLAEAV